MGEGEYCKALTSKLGRERRWEDEIKEEIRQMVDGNRGEREKGGRRKHEKKREGNKEKLWLNDEEEK